MAGISVWQLLIVLAIVLLLFGTKKLRTLGSDLGGLARDFKKSVKGADGVDTAEATDESRDPNRSLPSETSEHHAKATPATNHEKKG